MCKYLTLILTGFTLLVAAADLPPIKDYELINQEGKPFKLHSLKGKYVLLSFIFTRCPLPQMCPLNMRLNREVVEQWKLLPAWKRNGFPIHILAVTLDPAYDTASALKKYGEEQKLDWEHFTLATGEPKALEDLASEFNVVGLPAGKSISHNMKTELLNPLMVPIAEFKDNQFTPSEVINRVVSGITWWKWFFTLSATLAFPSLLLLFITKRIFAKTSDATA